MWDVDGSMKRYAVAWRTNIKTRRNERKQLEKRLVAAVTTKEAEAKTNSTLEKAQDETQKKGRSFHAGFSPSIPAAIINVASDLNPILSQLSSTFWNCPIKVKLAALSPKNLYFWRHDSFYVSQLPLSPQKELNADKIIQLRISDTACACLLSQALGKRDSKAKHFQVDQITSFEAQLLTEFSKELFASILKNMVNRKASSEKPSPLVHLVWGVQINETQNGEETEIQQTEASTVLDDELTGKIVLTLPIANIRLPKEKESPGLLGDTLFLDAHAEGKIWIGKTRITLDDIQELEDGDIVVLDDSQTNQLALLSPETQEHLFFNTEFNNRSQLEIPITDEQGFDPSMKENTMSTPKDKIWDSLMLDVNAEFFPTRLPLNQLKQMSEGLILEVGDLTQNDIRLHIEGKTVALGELVIVGEKFGVRIKEVKDKHEPGEATQITTTSSISSPAQTNEAAHPMESQEQAPSNTEEQQQPPAEAQQAPAAAAPEASDDEGDDDDWMNDDFDDDDGDEW